MRHQTSWKRRALRGALVGGLLTAIVSSVAGTIGVNFYPMLSVEALDPFFIEQAILVLVLLGAYTGAVLGGLTLEPKITWEKWDYAFDKQLGGNATNVSVGRDGALAPSGAAFSGAT